MANLARVGEFCPNEACPDYGKLQSDQQHNIKKFGKTRNGKQRFQCKGIGTAPGLLSPPTRLARRIRVVDNSLRV